jgi:DNA-binding FadR family transcriptional regulator
MNKEQEAIAGIQSFIMEHDLEIGAQLPSERKFAEMFLTSRNTVRNAIRTLEAKGFLEVRKGSGCYLVAKNDPFEALRRLGATERPECLHGLFEARYLLEPNIGYFAASKNVGGDIDQLEKCLVRLSRNFLRNQAHSIAEDDAAFRRLVAGRTGNEALTALMDQFTVSNAVVFTNLEQLNEESKERLFADYVEIIKALKKRDSMFAAFILERNILQQYKILKHFSAIDLPHLNEALIRPKTNLGTAHET